MAIEKSLNRKMRTRYNGPYVVLTRNRGGAYVICELDGSVLDQPLAAFRVIPYFARKHIEIPYGALDVHLERIETMHASASLGDDDNNIGLRYAVDEDNGIDKEEDSDELEAEEGRESDGSNEE
jgi:hypothetical protein